MKEISLNYPIKSRELVSRATPREPKDHPMNPNSKLSMVDQERMLARRQAIRDILHTSILFRRGKLR